MTQIKKKIVLFFSLSWGGVLFANPGLIRIVAAENFYASVAQNIGSPYVEVSSVLNSPVEDPHVFKPGIAVSEMVDQANIVIENGAGYDPWMDELYAASPKKAMLINVAQVLKVLPGENPHIWYAPQTMPAFAQALTQSLIAFDPLHKSEYQKNLSYFLQRANLYTFRVNKVRRQVMGLPVAATEPVFNDLGVALDLKIINEPLEWKVMNNVTLTPKEVSTFDESLKKHEIKMLVYNNQVTSPMTEQFKRMALKNNIPVVGVSELMPEKLSYYDWMHIELVKIAEALGVKV